MPESTAAQFSAHCAGDLLVPRGRILVVQSQFANPERTVAALNYIGLSASVCARVDIPFGPIIRRRTAYPRARGLSAPGQSHEELVVVRGGKGCRLAPAKSVTCPPTYIDIDEDLEILSPHNVSMINHIPHWTAPQQIQTRCGPRPDPIHESDPPHYM